MTKNHTFLSIAAVTMIAFAQGCSPAQEVEVTGEATAPATVTGPISLEFFDVGERDLESNLIEYTSVKKVAIAQPGPFKETVEVEGESIRIFALADANSDGACSVGEAWADVSATVNEDGTIAPVTLALVEGGCPVDAPK